MPANSGFPSAQPRLEVRWGGGWAEFVATFQAWRQKIPELPAGFRPAFRDAAVGKHWPGRSVGISAAAHILALVLPVPAFLTATSARPKEEFPRIEFDLQWTGTSRVLPPISPPRAPKRRPSPGGKPNQPLPPLGAEQPNRQTIVSTPENPNHPTHTVIRQNALEARLKPQELKLPNMVIPPSAAPEVTNELDLRRMRVPNAPLDLSGPPQTPRLPKRARSAVTMAEIQLKNLYPRLAVEPGAGGDGKSAAPEIEAPVGAARSGDLDLPGVIALSAAPSSPAPVVSLPEANLRARFVAGPYTGAGSPGGIPGGTPGASGGEGGGPGGYLGGAEGAIEVPGLLVTPAGPVPAGPVVVGPGGAPPPPPPSRPSAPARAATRERAPAAAPQRHQPSQAEKDRAEELFESLTPGLKRGGPRGRRVYTIYVNMPNLTSQSGSWVLRFAELGEEGNAPGTASDTAIESPVAVKKVDPGYPAEARRDKIEGTVFLYGVIRPDGSVDSVHVVRSVHASIDRRAVEAFQSWRFDPGKKNGVPVPLEVVVEIPFRLSQLF
ncbi:MAG TPA: TonB family protein [Candidatus Xenobia bacterium]|nr:TonB family protein [Candidatus Xenobia bacterium]